MNTPKLGLISTGNETIDKFLGGGLLFSSLNILELGTALSRDLDKVLNYSLASSTLTLKNSLIYVNFNPLLDLSSERLIRDLPTPKKVKTELLYKDIREKAGKDTIKIAWRYAKRSSSPPRDKEFIDQIDFKSSLSYIDRKSFGEMSVINVKDDFTSSEFFRALEKETARLKQSSNSVNIVIADLLNPFSPLLNKMQQFFQFLYGLRCYARTLGSGAILISYNTNMISDYDRVQEQIYSIGDCVISFDALEEQEMKLSGYKNDHGFVRFIKVPKFCSFGLHFQRELSDWGYRITKGTNYFVIDELCLPPLDDSEHDEERHRINRC